MSEIFHVNVNLLCSVSINCICIGDMWILVKLLIISCFWYGIQFDIHLPFVVHIIMNTLLMQTDFDCNFVLQFKFSHLNRYHPGRLITIYMQ